jgi:hypothetical protein
MNRDLASGMQHAHRTAAHGHAHSLADQPPGYRVGVAIHLDGTVGANRRSRSRALKNGGVPASGRSATASSRAKRRIGDSPVVP